MSMDGGGGRATVSDVAAFLSSDPMPVSLADPK
jgi:hypothetical protein